MTIGEEKAEENDGKENPQRERQGLATGEDYDL